MGGKRFLDSNDVEIEQLLNKVSPTPAFQPIVETCSAGIMGFEALLNGQDSAYQTPWTSFNKYTCSSDEVFFRLDMAFIEKAVRSSRALTTEHKLFINIRDFSLERITSSADHFMIFLESLEIAPGRVVIEISENIDPDYVKFIAKNIQGLQKKGIQIAIDNVGQNYAGLLHMDYIEPDYIKLDSSVTGGIDSSVERQNMVMGFSKMAAKMDVPIIATGVESSDKINALNKLGVPFAQWSVPIHPLRADRCFGTLKGNIAKPKPENQIHRQAIDKNIFNARTLC